LLAIVGEAIDADVFGARDVPEHPDDGVLTLRASAELGIAEVREEAVGHHGVKWLVSQEKELRSVHHVTR